LEEILGAAADAGKVVKSLTVLENGSSTLDSQLSRHIKRYSINARRAFARTFGGFF
jgi:hypothetical protein